MAIVRVDPAIGRVHAVTKTGETLCGTVGKKVIGSLNRGSISCEKCQRIIQNVKLTQDSNGTYTTDAATRDTALYGEKSVRIGDKTQSSKTQAKAQPKTSGKSTRTSK